MNLRSCQSCKQRAELHHRAEDDQYLCEDCLTGRTPRPTPEAVMPTPHPPVASVPPTAEGLTARSSVSPSSTREALLDYIVQAL